MRRVAVTKMAIGERRRGVRSLGTVGLATTMLVAVLAGTLGALSVGPASVAGATTTTVPNPDPALITQWHPCQPGAGVTEFVDFGPLDSGKVDVGCASTAAAQTNGFKALTDAGFVHATRPSTPGFLTTITGCPGSTCPVVGTIPSGAYWSYWLAKAPGDAWGYSGYGGAAPQTNGTAYPFQAWAFGSSTLPRVPVMDSAGPVAATPSPEPTSDGALALAESWVATVFSHLAAQCITHQSTCSSEQYANLDDYVEALTTAGVPTDQIDPTVLTLLRSSQVENAMATQAPTFISLGGLTTENGAAPLLSALTSLHTSSDTTEIDTLATRIQETLQPTGRYPGSVRLTPTTNEPTTNYPTPTTPTTPTKPVVATAVQAPVVNALLAAGVAVPVTAVDAVVSYIVGPLATTATKGTTSGVKRLSQQLVALVAILDATPAEITGGAVTPGRGPVEDRGRCLSPRRGTEGRRRIQRWLRRRRCLREGRDRVRHRLRDPGAGGRPPRRPAQRRFWRLGPSRRPLAGFDAAHGRRRRASAADRPTWASSPRTRTSSRPTRPTGSVMTRRHSLRRDTHNSASVLLENTLWDIDHAMLDWSLAPYADATIATPSATATTATATVTASVTPAPIPRRWPSPTARHRHWPDRRQRSAR